MIRLSEAAVLAYTKLRTRRILTTVAVVISGLLFSGLIAALVVAQGADASIRAFSTEGFNSRYIVQAQADPPLTYTMFKDKDIQARAQQLYAQTIADKKADAKRLGISYDATTEQQPLMSLQITPGQASASLLSLQSPAAQQALHEYILAHPGPGPSQLQAIAAPYHPTAYYRIQGAALDGTMATMKDGAENFSSDPLDGSARQSDLLQNNAVQAVDAGLAKPFLLPTQPAHYDPNAVPIVVSYDKAERLLGLPALPKSASPRQRLDRIKQLYATAGGATLTACYRNNVSATQIQTAISQAAEQARNQANKDYQKPHLIYGLPAADSCGPATVLSDTRTSDEKKADRQQDQFNQDFGQQTVPVQQKLTFRVVGLSPEQNAGPSTTLSGILRSVVGSGLDPNSIAIPRDMLDALPDAQLVKSVLFSPQQTNVLAMYPDTYFVEFASAADARHFINAQSCTTTSSGTCTTAARPFQLNAYGSNSIALQDLQRKFSHFFQLGAAGVVVVAIVIMTGTVGRMIADGRRETAVFRAIGAKRLDITAIYGLYTVWLSVYVALFALVAGVLAAHLFDRHFWQSTTVQAQLLFGASDTARQFHFFQLHVLRLAVVLGVAIVCGLLGMALPLLRNVRRNPIRDMREE